MDGKRGVEIRRLGAGRVARVVARGALGLEGGADVHDMLRRPGQLIDRVDGDEAAVRVRDQDDLLAGREERLGGRLDRGDVVVQRLTDYPLAQRGEPRRDDFQTRGFQLLDQSGVARWRVIGAVLVCLVVSISLLSAEIRSIRLQ